MAMSRIVIAVEGDMTKIREALERASEAVEAVTGQGSIYRVWVAENKEPN